MFLTASATLASFNASFSSLASVNAFCAAVAFAAAVFAIANASVNLVNAAFLSASEALLSFTFDSYSALAAATFAFSASRAFCVVITALAKSELAAAK